MFSVPLPAPIAAPLPRSTMACVTLALLVSVNVRPLSMAGRQVPVLVGVPACTVILWTVTPPLMVTANEPVALVPAEKTASSTLAQACVAETPVGLYDQLLSLVLQRPAGVLVGPAPAMDPLMSQ